MADRRMIHRKVVESDSFYSLSEGAQAIYMHLTINADEDGFINGAGSIVSRFKNGQAKLKELVERRFLLRFGDIYVIKHWRIGNSLKNDRTKPPTYPGVAAAIWVKQNRAYTDHPVDGCKTLLELKTGIRMESNRNPNGIQMESQKKRTEKKGTEENRTEPKRTAAQDFEQLWMEYPEERRGSIQMAEDVFRMEITSEEDADQAMENLKLWKQSEQWTKDNGQYVPYLDNWLNRGIWRTKPAKMAIPYGASRELDAAEIEAIQRMLNDDNLDQWARENPLADLDES